MRTPEAPAKIRQKSGRGFHGLKPSWLPVRGLEAAHAQTLPEHEVCANPCLLFDFRCQTRAIPMILTGKMLKP